MLVTKGECCVQRPVDNRQFDMFRPAFQAAFQAYILVVSSEPCVYNATYFPTVKNSSFCMLVSLISDTAFSEIVLIS